MHDSVTLTISPLGAVTLPAGATWEAVRHRVSEIFECSSPLQLSGGPGMQVVPGTCRVGHPPLVPGALLFVQDGGKHRRYLRRYLAYHQRALNRERRTLRRNLRRNQVKTTRGESGSWRVWQPAAVSALGSVLMAATLRQPMFALLGVLGLLGFLPQLLRRAPGDAAADHAVLANAPLRDSLPNTVPLINLLKPQNGFKVPIGLDAAGPTIYLDLIADGPHLLIAGTTGAGKSVVLRSLVLALAYQLTPAELALALVDFKGGASFGDCGELPHVAGLVTDLDSGLAERALAGLRAELARRKRILADHGASDIAQLPAGVLARLVVVFDEFRALTEELPDAVPQLFRIAAQGRSLGIHLILATQRAAGAVSPEVRANVSARLALRVTDAGDSLDLIDSPLAAGLPAVPGRGVLRLGAMPPQVVQCAWADAAPIPLVWRPDVPLDSAPLSPSLATQILRGSGPTGTATATATTTSTGAATGQPPNPQPPIWLPPLPTTIDLAELDSGGGKTIPFGLGDYPEQQSQLTVRWDTGAGHLGLIGRDPRTRTAALETIGLSAATLGWQVHWLGQLKAESPLTHHPKCRSIVGNADLSAAEQLLRKLADGSGSNRVLLLIDNAERWRDHYQVSQLITACSEVVAIAISSGSPSLGGFANLIASKLVLLSNDPNEDVLLGAPTKFAGKGHSSGHSPGRAVWFDAADPTGHGPTFIQIATTKTQP